MNKKNIAVVGCTGSVGGAALDICRKYPEHFEVRGLAANDNLKKLNILAQEFEKINKRSNILTCLSNSEAAKQLEVNTPLEELVIHDDIDHIVFAASGTDTIRALQKSISAGKEVSLANKESIVVAGHWVLPLIKYKNQLRPLDSEHNALWQSLHGEDINNVYCAYLTASGGAFLNYPIDELDNVTPAMALNHPVWNMGQKITIDSATLMNKGIELIEAMLLFGLEHHQVKAVISPGSFVHGLLEFRDGFVKLLAASPDMRLPALVCLSFPDRLPLRIKELTPEIHPKTISFETPDEMRFPCLKLAKDAARERGRLPALMIGADEIAVEAFIDGKIGFTNIAKVVEEVMYSCNGAGPNTLEEAIDIIETAKIRARKIIEGG
ncbi:MAG: 1-deoxy-D-xylulose-5-phosphate reductoisomerase [Synergistaceae bacterium]|nr:1-deoxy-D-xylulose-5-phosphate reductoisomerase [Synergistaceae bacterium]